MKYRIFGIAALLALATSGPAVAADMRVKSPVYKAAPAAVMTAYNWTGFYVGGHAGWGWGNKDWSDPADPVDSLRFDVDGFLGGGQVGFNWQAGNWVFGVEGEFSWSGIDGSTTLATVIPGFGGVGATLSSEVKWLATLTGRIGFAWDNWLWYVKGGGAWADEDHAISATVIGTALPAISASGTASGWTIGGGAEYGFAPNWSARLEYSYYDFDRKNYTFSDLATPVGDLAIDQHIHAVKFGINYRFGEFGKGPVGKGPVVTRY